MMRLMESGDFAKWEHKYISENYGQCLDLKPKKAKRKPLKLEQFTSSFILLGVGLSLGLLVFLWERFFARRP